VESRKTIPVAKQNQRPLISSGRAFKTSDSAKRDLESTRRHSLASPSRCEHDAGRQTLIVSDEL
jgi:hypothetical protein